ncbi:4Fe-4S binding protein [Geomonas paludis]|uniref:4Fe-4S binding protein n=1 Tax=Geomonas paludis TaxID=2740185 RepID=A0A6V8N1D8_9BACT|nr:4Fe-4S dicluster domain-containing protein [Geomonas paludis]UPU36902.1 4Fe-4S binding protein [Geomonas paludis]GFO65573.1 chemotaxis protein [Geomonas paludis]
MPVEITVHEQSCRGCELCVDICPTKVFAMDQERRLCTVEHAEDCIACLSCAYICPSGAITQRDFHPVKNFYRDEEFCQKMGKFL